MIDFKEKIENRFVRYTSFDTMSDPHNVGKKRPTTDGQVVFQRELVKELEELGLDVYYGKESVVMGTLKGNADGVRPIGFMAHVDTSSDVMGNGVKAIVHKNYQGGDIAFGDRVLSPSENAELLENIGSDIITSDGTTLLGSDDKAGVSIIMEALAYLKEHSEIRHGDIEVYFTPDEETGSGMDMFPYDRIKSYVCYTVDGGDEKYVNYECFNAATVILRFRGRNYHFGSARGKMVSAIRMAGEVISMLPMSESPEATDGRLGYYCPLEVNGNTERAELAVFVRDFDEDELEKRIERVKCIAESVCKIYRGSVDIASSISYHNMARANSKKPEAKESIILSAKKLGLDIEEELIRGGTDGARLSETGIPSPNLFTGGHNMHSLEEWVSVDSMNKSVNLLLSIIGYWADKR